MIEFRIFALWLLGAVIIIPYALYNLLFVAGPEQYAFLIVAPLFWIFGFWGVVGPLIAIRRIHRLMKALDQARTSKELQEAYHNNEGKDAVVDLIAVENRIPKFIVRRFYDKIAKKLEQKGEYPSKLPGS